MAEKSRRLKRLNARHVEIVALYLRGSKIKDIAKALDLNASWVSTVLSDPLVHPLLRRFEETVLEHIDELALRAVGELENIMLTAPSRTRLHACTISLYLRALSSQKTSKHTFQARELMARSVDRLRKAAA